MNTALLAIFLHTVGFGSAFAPQQLTVNLAPGSYVITATGGIINAGAFVPLNVNDRIYAGSGEPVITMPEENATVKLAKNSSAVVGRDAIDSIDHYFLTLTQGSATYESVTGGMGLPTTINKRYIIRTGGGRLAALGTRFTVDWMNPGTCVTVNSGIVRIITAGGQTEDVPAVGKRCWDPSGPITKEPVASDGELVQTQMLAVMPNNSSAVVEVDGMKIEKNTNIASGSKVEVKNGNAIVQGFAPGTAVTIETGATVRVGKDTTESYLYLEVLTGTATYESSSEAVNKKYTLRTGGGRLASLGTKFSVTRTGSTTRVAVVTPKVEIETPQWTLILHEPTTLTWADSQYPTFVRGNY